MEQAQIINGIFQKLDATRKRLFDKVDMLPSSAFEKRFDSKWNAPEILGHLFKYEMLVCTFFNNIMMNRVRKVTPNYSPRHLSEGWHNSLNDDTQRYKHPETMTPERLNKTDYKSTLQNSRTRLKNYINAKMQADFSEIIIPHPNGSKLSLIQWLELMEVHERRHIRQIEKLLF